MVGVSTIIAVCVTLFVSLILPVIVCIVYGVKHKGKGIGTAWLLGAAGFFVTQIIIRIPILNLLSLKQEFVLFSQEHYVLYCFILAFTAGLFEVTGRYVTAKIISKNMTFERGMAAGLGHGGIEAMLIVGMTYVNNLIYIIMINTGSFDATVEQAAGLGTDTTALMIVKEAMINTGSSIFYLAGYERILTMIAHVALSLIVCYFVSQKKDVIGIGICLLCHCLMDFIAPVIQGMSAGALGNRITPAAAQIMIYIFLTAVAAAAVFAVKYLKKKWTQNVSV